MKLARRFLVVILIVALLAAGFVLGQKNPLQVGFDLGFVTLPTMPLGVLVCVSLLLGTVIGLVIGWVKMVGLRMRVARLKRRLARESAASGRHGNSVVVAPSTALSKAQQPS